ncbi:MotA/TolQ/ExbB proton channel family protein [Aliarcobacter butzleri]|uniref:MotA/TolQ/ExbB proton channel family protein n=1 Tax=Aliarcobacter butzleri TaxID=28197 RepID=UPI00125F52E2|nr:MotA/TolQ/ExbB proton channel family protein [Aliarcobacter butzleri]MCT7550494.1 MotA/TolQ/ExbB proton channel family protein [Aliarcobacter butzleri]MCT7559676.1 MotA/TolQ/ExbB proton channel family protein [Aliarcobacter butzleri]MCT7594919.1 MotA/TolQ/ExbB proton channel family protein [Aliarcobacter butzleri]MCT7598277.1 MotA/TolQ/ExbB proton channel family protein [Aliarcobacter butzleri]MCT7626307.1 MotA/TolQ/ExbB proton channel family protein [Aliarcobacter butzleri]
MFIEDDFIELNSKFYTTCKPTSRIVTLLSVPIVLFIAVLLCYIGVFPLNVEIHSVILIGIILFIYLFFVKHNAYYVSCKFKTQYEDLAYNLKEYINNNLLTIGETTKANGSVDDFLQDYTSNIRNTNLSTIASGIFPTLGILGTFISIALSMPDFTAGTTQALESEITVLLGGVGTAFYVSIYGIFLSIWWIFFEKFGMSRFDHYSFVIKESTKSFFWTRIDIESIHIKSNLDNFTKMSNVFNQLTSSDILETINNSIERRFKALDELLNKELILSSKLDENIQMLNSMSKDISSTLNSFEKQKNLYTLSAELLNANIIKLNSHMDNLSSENLKSIYTNIVKSIETMKNDMEKIEWKFKKEIDEYDEKITHKLQNSLELIDVETSKIVKDLSEFKELSK